MVSNKEQIPIYGLKAVRVIKTTGRINLADNRLGRRY